MLVTIIQYVTVVPFVTCNRSTPGQLPVSETVFDTSIDGLITSTTASFVSVTSGPTGGVPTTLAVFVKSAVTVQSTVQT